MTDVRARRELPLYRLYVMRVASHPQPRRGGLLPRALRRTFENPSVVGFGSVRTTGKLVFGMMQSLDGYIDYVRGLAGMLYGRRIYEVMRYWDEDQPEWDAADHEFAATWRAKPKWVASRSLKSVGANATLVGDDIEAFVSRLKATIEGDISVAGPDLARSLTDLGLIDEYYLYLRPFVLGHGKPYFAGARPSLHLVATNAVGEDAVRLTLATA